ncbi:EVE domain-containing protein [Glaciihabitans sp. UYNi722]|uniref:EVE domain-containing protein n=1 Tax=Glaciihabitans sp. UYNi722 TaxID=3156344 RepID=UPI003392B90F
MSAWLGVVSRSHVLRAVGLGIAQANHGKRPPLARMQAGDGIVHYSPRTDYPDGAPLQAFTAIGRIADDELWQAHEEGFQPWRRHVTWNPDARETPIKPLVGQLEFTRGQNWGYTLRRGLISLSEADFDMIRSEMTSTP